MERSFSFFLSTERGAHHLLFSFGLVLSLTFLVIFFRTGDAVSFVSDHQEIVSFRVARTGMEIQGGRSVYCLWSDRVAQREYCSDAPGLKFVRPGDEVQLTASYRDRTPHRALIERIHVLTEPRLALGR